MGDKLGDGVHPCRVELARPPEREKLPQGQDCPGLFIRADFIRACVADVQVTLLETGLLCAPDSSGRAAQK